MSNFFFVDFPPFPSRKSFWNQIRDRKPEAFDLTNPGPVDIEAFDLAFSGKTSLRPAKLDRKERTREPMIF